jgi:hypothetical protein
MAACTFTGNILGEATDASGNILGEAMRHLAAFHVGLHVLGGDQLHPVAQGLEQARPVVRAPTKFDRYERWRQLFEITGSCPTAWCRKVFLSSVGFLLSRPVRAC